MTNEQLVIRVKAGEDTAGNMLKLWQQNKGFIAKMAKKYQGYAEMDDLMQEGYIALCEAVRQYDPEQGVTSFTMRRSGSGRLCSGILTTAASRKDPGTRPGRYQEVQESCPGIPPVLRL